MNTISIEYNGVTITYIERDGRWSAVKGDRTFSDTNLAELKKKLDRASQAKVERLNVLLVQHYGEFTPAEISSYDGHRPRISYKDSKGKTVRDIVYDSNLCDDTAENAALLKQMAPLIEQRNAINAQLHDLEKQITRTTIRAHYDRTRRALSGEAV